jgi:sugar (pentulose or hexulose) kinase
LNYLGLDVGTTTVTAIVVNSESGEVVSKATAPNDAETTTPDGKAGGRSEWDPARMLDVARMVLRDAAGPAGNVAAIGVTGQMHGMMLVNEASDPIGPFIGWQDQRATDADPTSDGTVIGNLTSSVESTDPQGNVCRPKAGYLGATLAWLKTHNALPDGSLATFLPDFLTTQLTDTRPVTDATNAAGSGLFDVAARQWHQPLLDRIGIEADRLPEVTESGLKAGSLSSNWSGSGLDAGIPVCVACGDNQASFLGSVRLPEESVLINVGTGGQVSVNASSHDVGPGLEARPHVDGRYILVGAGLVGGRTYAWLREFYLEIGRQVFDYEGDAESVYERMTGLAGAVDEGADGLVFEPLFTGTRDEPDRRGKIEGIGTTNFSPGHLSRALLEGVIAQFKWLYDNAVAVGAGERSTLVGAGNGVRKNVVLKEIAERTFGLEMRVPAHTEEAAYGAAMQAMVLGGSRKDLIDAGEVIQYA